MIGSDAPWLVLARLERLARPIETVGGTTALAALDRDPLAALAAQPLDDATLDALLARLASAPAPAGAAPLRRRRSARPDGRRSEARAARRPRTALVRRAERRAGDLAPPPEPSAEGAAAVGPEPGAARPGPLEALARVARPVASATAAATVPPARPAQGAEAVTGEGEARGAAQALDAVLRRFAPRLGPFPEPVPETVPEDVTRPLPAAPSFLPSPPEAAAEIGVEPSFYRGEPAAGGPHRRVGLPAARAGLLRPQAHGLAELVRRWQDDRAGEEPNAAAPRPEPAGAAGPPVDEQGLAAAVERLLLGELRRHGIEVDVG
jgi:hypothetical protein